MADTPAKRHVQRLLAASAATQAAGGQLMAGTPIHQQMQLQLAGDRARLKQLQSTQAKAQLKLALLPTYTAYVDGVLAANLGGDDLVVSTVMLWAIDAGDYQRGLHVAEYVLGHGLAMPDSFSRTTGCVVAEEVAVAALNAQRTGTRFDQAVLDRAVALTEHYDMPDQVRAKLLLARGRNSMLREDEQPVTSAPQLNAAIEDLRRAIQLHDSCGGKEDLKRAERLLKHIEATQSQD
jgi:hypothetical protein